MIAHCDRVTLGTAFKRKASWSSSQRRAVLRLKSRDPGVVNIDASKDRTGRFASGCKSFALFKERDARESERFNLIGNLCAHTARQIGEATAAIHLRFNEQRIKPKNRSKFRRFNRSIGYELWIHED